MSANSTELRELAGTIAETDPALAAQLAAAIRRALRGQRISARSLRLLTLAHDLELEREAALERASRPRRARRPTPKRRQTAAPTP
jgi:hypothetical protein